MRIGLMVHGRREDAVSRAKQAAEYLLARGVTVTAEDDAAALLGPEVMPFSQAHGADFIVALGGDGTLLRGAQYALRWDAALLGVNMGRVGFLAEVEPEGLEAALDAVMTGQYRTELRPLLEVRCGQKGWYALNDVVISRGGYSRLITIDALVDGDSTGRYVADGLIVATPTGSTGYSLSAGGPVISPRVDCMVITPICAHTLQHRPCVVHGGANIRLRLCEEDVQRATLEVDGQTCQELQGGMQVDVHKDERALRLIRLRQTRFFQTVRGKLTEWTR
ncbi:MAG: NAD(+)/NADH kinase [Clostridia bacterium]|nr:NAD(+)/NADH kinase [Clostridia bacterium]